MEIIVIRCKTDADTAVALTVNERDGEHGGADIADSAVFDARDINGMRKYYLSSLSQWLKFSI